LFVAGDEQTQNTLTEDEHGPFSLAMNDEFNVEGDDEFFVFPMLWKTKYDREKMGSRSSKMTDQYEHNGQVIRTTATGCFIFSSSP
jgi:hypothetical protein